MVGKIQTNNALIFKPATKNAVTEAISAQSFVLNDLLTTHFSFP